MLSTSPKSVTIIGAGLGGLTLALSLKKQGISSRMYELRTPDYDFGGALMLSPNALRVLDALDVYDRVHSKGFNFDTLTFMNDGSYEEMGKYYFGNKELYDYQALRIYRNVLIKEIRQIVHEQGIPIEYGRKFSHVVEETDSGVKFAFADGTIEEAEILVGADGIHSKIRQHLLPGIVAAYSGFLGVTFAFDKSKLRLPSEDFPLPVSIHGKNGAFVMAPQNPDGNEIFAGRQFKVAMKDRAGWDALLKEKTELIDMHQSDMSEWSDVVQSGQEQISASDAHSLNIWPFHTVPKLEKWSSEGGRIIILGDAAHAIPPTAGQGANQAFEDSYSLSLVLGSLAKKLELKTALDAWQEYRQARVEKVLALTLKMNSIRLPEEERKLLPSEQVWHDETDAQGKNKQLDWLYLHDIKDNMKELLAKVSGA